jgi:lysophospholipase L1-like esterase
MNNQKHLNGWAGLLLLFLLASSGLSQTNITKETKAMLPKTQALIAGKKPVRVVFYGDSISEVKTGWSGGASKPEQNWGAHLVRLLAKAYPDTTFTEAHFAIGGQNTYEGLGRLDGLEALKPDLVLVAFGANDCGYHFLIPEETQLALATLVTDIRKRFGADVIVVGTGGDNPLKPFFRHLDETLAAQRQAAAETGAPFADIRKAVLGATDNGKRWAEFHINEGNCHPTDKGHEVWAETVMAVVRSVITSAN